MLLVSSTDVIRRMDTACRRVLHDELVSREPWLNTAIIPDGRHTIHMELDTTKGIVRFFTKRWSAMHCIGKVEQLTDLSSYGGIEFDDLNCDGINEILLATAANMNGNHWFHVFKYLPQSDTVVYAGHLADYVVVDSNKTLQVSFNGSWYMDQVRSIYAWREDQLIPVRRSVLSLIDKSRESSGDYTLSYYINPEPDTDTLHLVFSELYLPNKPSHKKAWEGLFE